MLLAFFSTELRMVLRPGDGGDFFGAPGERELPCCVVTKVGLFLSRQQ